MESLNVSKMGFVRLSENPERLDETRGKSARNIVTMLVPLGRLLTETIQYAIFDTEEEWQKNGFA